MKKLISVIVLLVIAFSVTGRAKSYNGLYVSRAIAMEKNKPNKDISLKPTALVFPAVSPNDKNFTAQWNLFNDGQTYQGMTTHFGIQALKAWQYVKSKGVQGGNGVKIAIIGSGVAYENYNLKEGKKIIRAYKKAPDFVNTKFDTANARDFTTDADGGIPHANDDIGWETEMCGVIAASTNNYLGSAGIAYNATILPIKVFSDSVNVRWHWIAEAIEYAADKGAKVIVLRFVGSSPENHSEEVETLIHDALTYAHEKGAVIVCSAYKYPTDSTWISYLITAETIHVGGARIDGTRTTYSYFNTEPLLEILAPVGTYDDLTGDGLMEKTIYESFDTYPPYGTGSTYNFNQNFQYVYYAHDFVKLAEVAGVAALIMSIHPTWTPEQVKTAILMSAKHISGPTAWPNATYGYGSLDAYAAVSYTPTP